MSAVIAILAIPFTAQCDVDRAADLDDAFVEPAAEHRDCDCPNKAQARHDPSADPGPLDRLAARDIADIERDDAPAWGSDDAPVTVVLFADHACPYCARAVNTLTALKAEYRDKLRIVFRQRPLPMHPDAYGAAKAVLAAAEQGAFDSYQRSLYADQEHHDTASLEERAGALGLDVAAFEDALASSAIEERVRSDLERAERLGVKGTPTFFVNGRRITGAWPAEKIRPIIDEALIEAR